VSPGLSGADQFPVRLGEATVTDILTNDEISLLRSLEKKSRTITGNLTHKRYDRLETEGYIKRSSPPSMPNMLYEITDAGKAALRAAGGAAG
jgi:DNA-binding HxlR family transcriptional regulator